MVAVYADAVHADAVPPLDDVNCQLLNFIEVYGHNGSGWVFSNFVFLQLTLWYLDPLRASAVDLLIECNGVQHYTTIKNFSRLLRSQLSNNKMCYLLL